MALSHNFTSGPIAGPLFRFALPVMGATTSLFFISTPLGRV